MYIEQHISTQERNSFLNIQYIRDFIETPSIYRFYKINKIIYKYRTSESQTTSFLVTGNRVFTTLGSAGRDRVALYTYIRTSTQKLDIKLFQRKTIDSQGIGSNQHCKMFYTAAASSLHQRNLISTVNATTLQRAQTR